MLILLLLVHEGPQLLLGGVDVPLVPVERGDVFYHRRKAAADVPLADGRADSGASLVSWPLLQVNMLQLKPGLLTSRRAAILGTPLRHRDRLVS